MTGIVVPPIFMRVANDLATGMLRSELTTRDRDEMLGLLQSHFDGVTPLQFDADLDSKDWVLRITRDDALVGFSTLKAAQTEARAGVVPERPIVHGAMIVIAAFLLIIPGFLTDIVGILLFLPFIRDFAWSLVRPHVTVMRESRFTYRSSTKGEASPRSTVIDLDERDYRHDPNRSSPWSVDDERKD